MKEKVITVKSSRQELKSLSNLETFCLAYVDDIYPGPFFSSGRFSVFSWPFAPSLDAGPWRVPAFGRLT